jgi:hypothetical protein
MVNGKGNELCVAAEGGREGDAQHVGQYHIAARDK